MRLRPWLVSVLLVGACGAGEISGNGDGGADAFWAPDADGDGLSDQQEGIDYAVDTDDDGTPDYLDDDSDGDGVLDYREAGDQNLATPPRDSDGDGDPDFRDTDSDDNGRPDNVDGGADIDGDGVLAFADLDDDNDAIGDSVELGADPLHPIDSDRDGTPDFQDIDSDGDAIRDLEEGTRDGDGDTVPAYLDPDSDNDCVPDSAEAGDSDPLTAAANTDGDLAPDFLDLDSDGDGLADQVEDRNCNGAWDGSESSRVSADTDSDGVSDMIEVAAGTSPVNPADNPQENGDFVFVVPYNGTPSPDDDTLDFETEIVQADVFFLMDTTGSMSGYISNLKSSLSTIIGDLATAIPDVAVGVGQYRDFPTSPYGSGGDMPFALHHRIMTVATPAGVSSVQTALTPFTAGGGNDGPESAWEALHQVATGAGTTQGGASVAAFSASAYPATPPAGESIGDLVGVGFREGSLPIVVYITDASGHNSDAVAGADYSGIISPRSTAVIAELNAIHAKVIGVSSGGSARTDQLSVVNGTSALVPPDAWGGSCGAGMCCTGVSGAAELPSSGTCPLSFLVNSSGAGLDTSIVTAIQALTTYGTLDIGAVASDDAGDTVDAVAAFISSLEAHNVTESSPACTGGLTVVSNVFQDVTPGTPVCYNVIPKSNTTVAPLAVPQLFTATIVVQGNGVTTLDTRRVYFLVPPEIPDIPVD